MEKYASNMLFKISQDLLFCFFLLKYNALSLLSILGKTNPRFEFPPSTNRVILRVNLD